MKKTLRLTESELVDLVKKIIEEQSGKFKFAFDNNETDFSGKIIEQKGQYYLVITTEDMQKYVAGPILKPPFPLESMVSINKKNGIEEVFVYKNNKKIKLTFDPNFKVVKV